MLWSSDFISIAIFKNRYSIRTRACGICALTMKNLQKGGGSMIALLVIIVIVIVLILVLGKKNKDTDMPADTVDTTADVMVEGEEMVNDANAIVEETVTEDNTTMEEGTTADVEADASVETGA
ncbi:hypothetical protein H6776_00710 [Candidatus Nomurabacteria bacterium]|nr:hypothetical protein [Candidatus Nomurabacteria bacterium]